MSIGEKLFNHGRLLRCNCYFLFLLWTSCCFITNADLSATELELKRPGEREFVRDLAGMLDPASTERIRSVCERLLTDTATPIIVITIESMAKYGGEEMRIETFATLLFDQWGIGQATLAGQSWNTGILLLVSRDDRKARIELGDGWGRREDELCRQIMNDHIIARFKDGSFSQGIVAGVDALDRMARSLELPRPPIPWRHYALVLGFVALAIFTIVSLIRRGSSGWAWLFWGVVFTILGSLLYHALTQNRRGGRSGYSGGGFGGGSFGGGFSGGGGATGSW